MHAQVDDSTLQTDLTLQNVFSKCATQVGFPEDFGPWKCSVLNCVVLHCIVKTVEKTRTTAKDKTISGADD